jgi:protein tyrosine phosphatase (PTP) superfamily phosphohydrolase (DUF442 family)
MSLEAIYNFVPISDHLATAGQPTAEQIEEIADAGYEVIINLDLPNSRYALPDEPGLAQSAGIRYHNIPVHFDNPTVEDLRRFFTTLAANEEHKTLVHCAANYRVSTFTALYGQIHWGWSEAEADQHIHRLWEPNPVWARFIEHAREELGLSNNDERRVRS